MTGASLNIGQAPGSSGRKTVGMRRGAVTASVAEMEAMAAMPLTPGVMRHPVFEPDMAGTGLRISETVAFGRPHGQTGGHRKCEGQD